MSSLLWIAVVPYVIQGVSLVKMSFCTKDFRGRDCVPVMFKSQSRDFTETLSDVTVEMQVDGVGAQGVDAV